MTEDEVERAAITLVVALGQDWPVEQPGWRPDVVQHWRAYKASWRAAARKILAAADDPAGMPDLCPRCGASMAGAADGLCPKRKFNHPEKDAA